MGGGEGKVQGQVGEGGGKVLVRVGGKGEVESNDLWHLYHPLCLDIFVLPKCSLGGQKF